MEARLWTLYIDGETFGPIPSTVAIVMLKQNRLQFSDFIWTDGLERWVRVGELDEFAVLLPPYPNAQVPTPKVGTPEQTDSRAKASQPALSARTSIPAALYSDKKKGNSRIRRFVRVGVQATVEVRGHGSFDVINLSEGGMFIKTPNVIPLGTSLALIIRSAQLPAPLELDGNVVRGGWVDGFQGMGVEFSGLNPTHRQRLSECVLMAFKSKLSAKISPTP